MRRAFGRRGAGCHGNCRGIRKCVYDLLDGRLTAERRREIERCLRSNPHCFSRFEFARIMRQVVRKRVSEEPCPLRLLKRVRSMIARECRLRPARKGESVA